mgnify:CR=1 FL=1
MELTELVYFTTIAQTGNMSRAAKKLQVSQPALSVAIRKLERDFKCCRKNSRGICGEYFKPSERNEALLPHLWGA